ncbi:hypothetical protein VIS19158_15651 [Vibrio scophthalmi LMG 19158]|uniref:Uncharacterized protein n=1 Tax=Vibrio scophthalmi LMG 19158 TaxID=870967 RepID=F9RI72_9VIBR|nr:hypothetical protein VIS19158_15651 [Vibrio scophthalmi LMG 19158]
MKNNLKKMNSQEKKAIRGGFYSKPGHPDYDREPGKIC